MHGTFIVYMEVFICSTLSIYWKTALTALAGARAAKSEVAHKYADRLTAILP